jgi:hypothetical protein
MKGKLPARRRKVGINGFGFAPWCGGAGREEHSQREEHVVGLKFSRSDHSREENLAEQLERIYI